LEELSRLAQRTDNEVDDAVIRILQSALGGRRDVQAAKQLQERWQDGRG
jgi:hypothetical protein